MADNRPICLGCWRERYGMTAEPPVVGIHTAARCECRDCDWYNGCGRTTTSGLTAPVWKEDVPG